MDYNPGFTYVILEDMNKHNQYYNISPIVHNQLYIFWYSWRCNFMGVQITKFTAGKLLQIAAIISTRQEWDFSGIYYWFTLDMCISDLYTSFMILQYKYDLRQLWAMLSGVINLKISIRKKDVLPWKRNFGGIKLKESWWVCQLPLYQISKPCRKFRSAAIMGVSMNSHSGNMLGFISKLFIKKFYFH